jgi:endonuclease YncB( thermonuclease family)
VGKPDESIGNYQPSVCSNQHQINRELVAKGWWWYRKYAPEDVMLVALEAAARVARKGLWVDSSPMLPWEWRKGAN